MSCNSMQALGNINITNNVFKSTYPLSACEGIISTCMNWDILERPRALVTEHHSWIMSNLSSLWNCILRIIFSLLEVAYSSWKLYQTGIPQHPNVYVLRMWDEKCTHPLCTKIRNLVQMLYIIDKRDFCEVKEAYGVTKKCRLGGILGSATSTSCWE